MSISKWCDTNSWYNDKDYINPANRIPINKVDDINIEDENYTFTITDNFCFSFIPSMICNNLHIVPGLFDSVGNVRDLMFYCVKLMAENVVIDPHVTCKNWDNSLCEWTVNSLSGEFKLYNVQCQANDFIKINPGSELTKTYFDANNIILDGCLYEGGKIQSSDITISGMARVSSALLNGTCNISSHSNLIGCTGNGRFNFSEGSKNQSTIFGQTTFSYSHNESIIYGNSIFSGNSSNKPGGVVVGNCIFIDSVNQGVVSGNAVFTKISGSSINSGIINDRATFNSGTVNAGIVRSDASFENSENSSRGSVSGNSRLLLSSNYGELFKNTSFISGYNNGTVLGQNILISNVFNDSDGTIDGYVSLTGHISSSCTFISSINKGRLSATNMTVSSGSVSGSYTSWLTETSVVGCQKIGIGINCRNDGYISAVSCTFAKDSINNGNIHPGLVVPLISISTESGIVEIEDIEHPVATGNIVFNYATNNGIVSQGCLTTFNHSFNLGSVLGECIFDHSTNLGTTSQLTSFNNQSINSPQGITNGLTRFSDKSINYGTTNSFVYFKDNSSNSGINTIPFSTFINTSKNFASVQEGYFYDQSINHGIITNSGDFFDTSKNSRSGFVNGTVNFYDNSINSGYISSAYFRDSSINFYTNSSPNGGTILFYNRAQNKGGLYSATFYDVSKNNGTGYGRFEFMDTSYNYGSLISDCITLFYSYSTNKGKIYTGHARFLEHSRNEYRISGCPGTLKFEDFSINASIIEDTNVVFMGSSSNEATIKQNPEKNNNITFRNSGINNGTILNYSSIYFNDQSINSSTINTNQPSTISFNGSQNQGTITATSGSVINFTFATNSNNIKADNVGFDSSINYGIITSGTFNNGSINFANIGYGFFNEANNFGNLIDGIFNQSINSGNIFKNATFNDYSINYGTINGSGGFFTYSCNYGTVLGELLTDFSCVGDGGGGGGDGGGGGGGGDGGGGGGGGGGGDGVEWG